MRCKSATLVCAFRPSAAPFVSIHASILSLYVSRPLWLHFELPELLNFDFDADADLAFDFDADPTPAFHSDAVPDPTSQKDADPCDRIRNNGLKSKMTSVLVHIYSDIYFTNRRRGTIIVLPILRFG
jgi:hypothetical protein